MKISLVVLAFLFLIFQNCSDAQFESKSDSSQKEAPLSLSGNGEGYDGKIRRYVEPNDNNQCDNDSEIANEINVDLATKKAFKVVEDCEPVSWKSITGGIPDFDPDNDSSFFFEGINFKSAGVYSYSSSGSSSNSGSSSGSSSGGSSSGGGQFMDLFESDPDFDLIDPSTLPPPFMPPGGPLFPFGPPPGLPEPPPPPF